MKRYLYRKWNFLALWNKLVLAGRLVFNKKVFFIQFDMSWFYFWDFNRWKHFLMVKKLYLKALREKAKAEKAKDRSSNT